MPVRASLTECLVLPGKQRREVGWYREARLRPSGMEAFLFCLEVR